MDAIIKELEIDLNHKLAIQRKMRTQRADLDRSEAQNEGAIMTLRDTIDKFKKRQLDPTTIARNIEEKAMQQRAKEAEEEKKKRAQQMKDEDEKKKQSQKLKEEEKKQKKMKSNEKHVTTAPSSDSCYEIPSDDSTDMMMGNINLDELTGEKSVSSDQVTEAEPTNQKSKGRAKRNKTVIKTKH